MNVEVILLKDIENVGQKDTVKTVARGFARNYLLALGLAILATPEEIERIESRSKTKRQNTSKSD